MKYKADLSTEIVFKWLKIEAAEKYVCECVRECTQMPAKKLAEV